MGEKSCIRRAGCFCAAFFLSLMCAAQTGGEPMRGVSFREISELIAGSCSGCHEWARAGAGIADTARIAPGEPDRSPLFLAVSEDRMPPGQGKLSEAQKLLLRGWVAQGAPTREVSSGAATRREPPYPPAYKKKPAAVPQPCPCGLK